VKSAARGMETEVHTKPGFHTELQRCRIEADLTQIELARRTGISQPRIATLEAGGARPSKQSARKIARALALDVERVFPDYASLREACRVAGGAS
jgi:transcriptional regulator with XRE-family HTH domain